MAMAWSSQPADADASSTAGLELFGVKLADASKLFGKKFAAGASITKNPMDKDQIEVRALRVEFVEQQPLRHC